MSRNQGDISVRWWKEAAKVCLEMPARDFLNEVRLQRYPTADAIEVRLSPSEAMDLKRDLERAIAEAAKSASELPVSALPTEPRERVRMLMELVRERCMTVEQAMVLAAGA